MKATLEGWGRFPKVEVSFTQPKNESDVFIALESDDLIARGSGRSYGDSSLNSTMTVGMTKCSSIISFDELTGVLQAEAGATFDQIISMFLPRGWFPIVTPGTKFASLGGMIASDVHGKNHHNQGSFVNSVLWFDIILSDGLVKRCSRDENADIFWWTHGGMGLTGVIIRAAIRLQKVESAWIEQNIIVSENLQETMQIFDETVGSEYSVAWLDTSAKNDKLGRAVVMFGRHAKLVDLPKRLSKYPLRMKHRRRVKIFIDPKINLIGNWLSKVFSLLYFYKAKLLSKNSLLYFDDYFYPLDKIADWNKLYGSKGFVQYQFVLPLKTSKQGLAKVLEILSENKTTSSLTVLKKFGPQTGKISFPMEGYTLALDLPRNRKNLEVLDKLDEEILRHGGRFYLAKDSRMTASTFRKSDPRTSDFMKFRDTMGLAKFKSNQSERL